MKRGSAFEVTVRRPVAILMVTVAAVVFGVFSYRLLSVELMPDVSYPSLTVRTEYSGAAPQEVEENVTRPVEEALGVVGGLVRLSSISRANLSDVTLEFTWDTAMSQAWQEVTERLDTLFLPQDAEKPLILRYDPQLEPVLRLALASERSEDAGPAGLRRLRTYAEQTVKRRLEQIEGVAAVRVLGGLEEQVAVDLDEGALRRTGLSIQEVSRRLDAENVNLAGGDLEEGSTRYLVRTVNEFETLDEIAELVVARVGGRDVRVRDLGTVAWGWADRQVITRLRSAEAVELEIQKEADANVVSMAAAVRGRLFEDAEGERSLSGDLPDGWRLELVGDRSTFIEASVREVRDTALFGGLLAVLVLYLFLRDFRMTTVVAIAIPVSVATVFAPMNLSGLTLNIMSLGGLALGIGMLVDSGIVVVESITRCREEGDDLATAVVRGTSEVGSAVIASTLTTVAVFFPMVFVEGVAGQVFADLALTVVYALLASLLVAIFLVPALTARVAAPAGGAAGAPRIGILERLRRSLLYRGLGPLSEDGGTVVHVVRRWTMAILLPPFVMLAMPTIVRFIGAGLAAIAPQSGGSPRGGMSPGGFGGPPPEVVETAGVLTLYAIPGLVLIAIVVVTNVVSRVRRAGVRAKLAAVLLAPIDLCVVSLESAWLAIVWAVILVGVPLVVVGWIVARIGRVVTWPLVRLFDAVFSAVQRLYPRVLVGALEHRVPVLVVAAAALGLAGWGMARLDTALIPEVHQGEFDVELTLPVGTPIERTLREVAPLEAWALEDPRIDRVLLRVGADPDADAGPEEGEHTARLSVGLAPEPESGSFAGRVVRFARRVAVGLAHAGSGGAVALREEEIIADLRRRLAGFADVQAKITRPVLFSFRTPVEIEIEAYDLDVLRSLGETVRAELDGIPYLTDVRSTARAGSPEIQIAYDRDELVRRGLDVREVAELVRTKVRGSSATEYRKRERRIDVVVRLAEGDRATVRQLRNLVVNPGGSVPVSLGSIADIRIAAGPADIRRVGQTRVALIQANLSGGGLGRAGVAIEKRLRSIDWPEGSSWRIAGQVQEMERSLSSLWIALGLSVFLVYVVMASQFESLLHPLLIMVTVPLAFVGVVGVLGWLAIPLSVVVFLGMIMLAGIVVNNAIVLVDYVNRLRRRGLPVRDALVEAGSARLRPILMTTATTILGLLPMSLGLGDGAEIRTPMALTVIAGLISSTVLTLVVLPTLYESVEAMRSPEPDATGSVRPAPTAEGA